MMFAGWSWFWRANTYSHDLRRHLHDFRADLQQLICKGLKKNETKTQINYKTKATDCRNEWIDHFVRINVLLGNLGSWHLCRCYWILMLLLNGNGIPRGQPPHHTSCSRMAQGPQQRAQDADTKALKFKSYCIHLWDVLKQAGSKESPHRNPWRQRDALLTSRLHRTPAEDLNSVPATWLNAGIRVHSGEATDLARAEKKCDF